MRLSANAHFFTGVASSRECVFFRYTRTLLFKRIYHVCKHERGDRLCIAAIALLFRHSNIQTISSCSNSNAGKTARLKKQRTAIAVRCKNLSVLKACVFDFSLGCALDVPFGDRLFFVKGVFPFTKSHFHFNKRIFKIEL